MFLGRGGVKKGAHEEKEAMRSKVLGVPVSYRQFSTYLFITFPLDQPHLCSLTGSSARYQFPNLNPMYGHRDPMRCCIASDMRRANSILS